eukprot:11008957-Ditylum_brightwellii.AAC.1
MDLDRGYGFGEHSWFVVVVEVVMERQIMCVMALAIAVENHQKHKHIKTCQQSLNNQPKNMLLILPHPSKT